MAGELSECLEHHVQGAEGGTLCIAQDHCQQHAHRRECIPTGYLVGSVPLSL